MRLRVLNFTLIGFVTAGLAACSMMSKQDSSDSNTSVFEQQLEKQPQSIVKPLSDARQYQALTLDNGLEVLLISDAKAQQAAAALDVYVGSGADPKQHQGLAHFLEHMLFLGTQKYPQPDEYQSFLAANGGSHNAYTSFEHTNYFFSVNASEFEPALDRFAQFFIDPLFSPEYVEREKNAVNSEYSARIKNEFRRSLDAYKAVIKQDHALANFSVGSLETLSDDRVEGEAGIRSVLLDFYQRYYHAGMMRLVVLGSEDLKTLEQMAKSKFSAIKAGKRELLDFSGELFEPGQLPALLQVQPEKDLKTLTLSFAIGDVNAHWRDKPTQYIGHLLGHEGEGSLLAYLKRQGWASGISAGLSNSVQGYADFSIRISLTAKGVKQWQQVVDASFAAIEEFKRQEPKAWVYNELAKLGELEFNFLENAAPIHTASSLANRLQLYPAQQVIAGPYWYQSFKPELIKHYWQQLSADKVLITLVSKDVQSDKVSPYFHAPFSFSALTAEQKQRWSQPEKIAAIHLPKVNPFLIDDVAALQLSKQGDEGLKPELIEQSERLKVWYLKDSQFGLPKTNIYLNAKYSQGQKQLETSVLLPLYSALINEKLKHDSYLADLAGLHIGLRNHSRGLSLRISGFDDKQAVLLADVLSIIKRSQFTEAEFERFKQSLLRQYANNLLAGPAKRLQQGFGLDMLQPSWSEVEKISALEKLNLNDVQAFAADFWPQVRWEVFMHGQQSKAQLAQLLEQQLNPFIDHYAIEALLPQQSLDVRALGKQANKQVVDASHSDRALLVYWQGKDESYQERARLSLAAQVLQPLYFHQLRTQQQLGYIVYATPYSLFNAPGMAFIVQSPVADTKALVKAQKGFMAVLVEQGVDEASFKQHQAALIAELQIPFKTMKEATESYWQAMALGRTSFDHKQQLAKAVTELDYYSWLSWLKQRLQSDAQSFWLANDNIEALPGYRFSPMLNPDLYSVQ